MLIDLLKYFKDYSLEKRVLIVLGYTGIVFSLLTSVMNSVLELETMLMFSTIGSGLSAYMVLYLLYKYEDHKFASYFGIISLNVLLYPSLWIFNGGSNGPSLIFMLFNAILIAVVLNRYSYVKMAIFQIIVLMLLLLSEYSYPNLIRDYSNDFVRLIDYGFSFTLVFAFSVFVIVKIMNEYNKTINKFEEMNKEIMEVNQKLKIASETDEMTGLYNRRYIMNLLEDCMQNHASLQYITLIMIDIDHFKSINDTYGHSFGDEVIKSICSVISSNLRKTDKIGRIGGEEFLIVMPDIDKNDAELKAEILRELVAAIEWPNDELEVTISCGVYSFSSDETIDVALEQVDLRLYKAKELGRNMVISEIS